MKDATNQTFAGLGAEQHVSGLLAGYALGALEPDETEQVLRHLSFCPRCQAELQDYQFTAGLLAYNAPVQQVPVRARAAMLSRVAEIGSSNPEQMVALPPVSRPELRRLRLPWHAPRSAWFAAAPVAVLVVVLTISSLVMRERLNEQQSELQSVEAARGTALEVLAVESTDRFVNELTASNAAPGARARLFVDLKANNAMLVAIDLPPPAEGGGYVAWLMVHDEYSLVGPLELDSIGRTQLIIDPPDNLDKYQSFVVTLEPDVTTVVPVGPRVFEGAIHPRGDGSQFFGFIR